MATVPDPFQSTRNRYASAYEAADTTAGAGVASFFNAVYAWMAAGLALTAVVAWWVSTQHDLMVTLFRGPLLWVCLIAEIGLVIAISSAIQRISASTATLLFLIYAALNGLTLAGIFLVYTHAVLASAFIITAGTFGVMSLYGMLTRRDLSSLGSILFMGLIGIILASIVSMFWHNSMLTVAINYLGVLIFVGLTAYQTQQLKQIAGQVQGNAALAARLSITGALTLYLAFLNLFLFILSILGGRDNR